MVDGFYYGARMACIFKYNNSIHSGKIMITDKQMEIANRIIDEMNDLEFAETMRDNIQIENAWLAQQEEAQRPTPEQRERRFNI